jgi:tetraacyldisaccharide 4'-kinase
MPAGRFREPLSALRRADAVLFTKGAKDSAPDAALVRRLRGRPLFRGELRASSLVTCDSGRWHELPLGRLAGRRALVVTGLADRDPFYQTLLDWETHAEDFLEFPDHHAYDSDDWKKIALRSREFDLVVTTEKDLIKLEQFPFAKEKLVAVRVAMDVEDGERLLDLIEDATRKTSTA